MQISQQHIIDTVNLILHDFRITSASCRNPLTVNAHFRDSYSKLSGIRLLFPVGVLHHKIVHGLNELIVIRDESYSRLSLSIDALDSERRIILSTACDLGTPYVQSSISPALAQGVNQ